MGMLRHRCEPVDKSNSSEFISPKRSTLVNLLGYLEGADLSGYHPCRYANLMVLSRRRGRYVEYACCQDVFKNQRTNYFLESELLGVS